MDWFNFVLGGVAGFGVGWVLVDLLKVWFQP